MIKYLFAFISICFSILFFFSGCERSHLVEIQGVLTEFYKEGNFNVIIPYIENTSSNKACIDCIEKIIRKERVEVNTNLKNLDSVFFFTDSVGILLKINDDTIKFIRNDETDQLSIKCKDVIKLLKGESMILKQIGDCLVDKRYFGEALKWYQAILNTSKDLTIDKPLLGKDLLYHAEKGSSFAMVILGQQISNSIKANKIINGKNYDILNDTTHISWLRKAYEKGELESSRFLGEIYEDGIGIKPDTSKAILWYFKSFPEFENSAILPLVFLLSSNELNGVHNELVEKLKERMYFISTYDAVFWQEVSICYRTGKYNFPIDKCLEMCALEKSYLLGNKDILPKLVKMKKKYFDCKYDKECILLD